MKQNIYTFFFKIYWIKKYPLWCTNSPLCAKSFHTANEVHFKAFVILLRICDLSDYKFVKMQQKTKPNCRQFWTKREKYVCVRVPTYMYVCKAEYKTAYLHEFMWIFDDRTNVPPMASKRRSSASSTTNLCW